MAGTEKEGDEGGMGVRPHGERALPCPTGLHRLRKTQEVPQETSTDGGSGEDSPHLQV